MEKKLAVTNGIPEEVLSFARGVSQLRRDTGVESFSFDWSEPMIQLGDKVYFLTWDSDSQEYAVDEEWRQQLERLAKEEQLTKESNL